MMMLPPAAAAAAPPRIGARRHFSTSGSRRHHRHGRLVLHEVDRSTSALENADEAVNNCRDCQELLQRHRRCISAFCYLLSLAYLLCLATITYLYVARQTQNLTLLAADVAVAIPADPVDCFPHARPLAVADNADFSEGEGEGEDESQARRVAQALPLADCGGDSSVRGVRSFPPRRLHLLRHMDRSLLALGSSASAVIVQWRRTTTTTTKEATAADDCGAPASAAAAGAVACADGNLTVARLHGGGCPLSHFLDSDIRLRLRLALRLLALADDLDSGGGGGVGNPTLSSAQQQPQQQQQQPLALALSTATQLDDFGVDRAGHVRLINVRRLRVLAAPRGGGGDGAAAATDPTGSCPPPGSLSNHATVASLLQDAYSFIGTDAAAASSRSPPSLGRSFLRGWSNWAQQQQQQRQQQPEETQQLAPLPLLPNAWQRLSNAEKLAERQRLLRAIEASLHYDDPVLETLWWSVCLMSSATLVFVLLRYWLCFRIIVCLERTCT